MERRDSGFLAFLLGLATGAIIGILYAPRSGEETRKILKKAIEDYAEEGKKIYEKKSEEFQEALETGKKTAKEKIEVIKEKAGEISETIKEKVHKIAGKEEESGVEVLPEE